MHAHTHTCFKVETKHTKNWLDYMVLFLILFIFQTMLETHFLSNDGYISVHIVYNDIFPTKFIPPFSSFL